MNITKERNNGLRVCSRCVMDTSDPDIFFDEDGCCNHCANAYDLLKKYPFNLSAESKQNELNKKIDSIKGSGKQGYDCIVGMSGGVDSSYVCYLLHDLGLNPLAVHVDNGWDTDFSTSNINRIVGGLGIDLHNVVLDWNEFRDMQLAFLRSGTPDLEIPTDYLVYCALYEVAAEFGVKHIVSGTNSITESISVPRWSHGHYDYRYIRFIQKTFGSKKIRSLPLFSPFDIFYNHIIKGISIFKIIDYLPEYNKYKIMELLTKTFGWSGYDIKHSESTYTFFVQSYILPVRFGFDKRKMHLSNLIVADQMTRNAALDILKESLFKNKSMEYDLISKVCYKLGITCEQFNAFMSLPKKNYYDYPSYNTHPIYRMVRDIYKKMKGFG